MLSGSERRGAGDSLHRRLRAHPRGVARLSVCDRWASRIVSLSV